jgi:ABC-2 type transport system ATP-binding protein
MGRPVPGRPEEVNALLAYVPDSPSGFEHLSPPEYFRLVAAVHRADAEYTHRCGELTRILGLEPYAKTTLGNLSYGSRRKVAIVAAAALDRPLLLLDEATNGLDPESVVVLERLVRGLVARGRTVVVATQDVYFAERVCDVVDLIAGGRIAASGRIDDIKQRHGVESLRDAFLAVTGLGVSGEMIDAALARTERR